MNFIARLTFTVHCEPQVKETVNYFSESVPFPKNRVRHCRPQWCKTIICYVWMDVSVWNIRCCCLTHTHASTKHTRNTKTDIYISQVYSKFLWTDKLIKLPCFNPSQPQVHSELRPSPDRNKKMQFVRCQQNSLSMQLMASLVWS